MLLIFPDTPHAMDPARGALERCTVRRCSVPGWPVPSLSVSTPLTAANSVQVRGVGAEASWGREGSLLPCPGQGVCGEGMLRWGGGVDRRGSSANSAFIQCCSVPAWSQGSAHGGKNVCVLVGCDGIQYLPHSATHPSKLTTY